MARIPRPVVKVSKRTREVVGRYKGCGQAAEENGVSYNGVRYGTNSIPKGEHYFRYADSFDPDENFEGMANCPVIARDIKTGQMAWYCDTTGASEKLGVSTASIYQSIRKGSVVAGRITFAYYGKRIVRKDDLMTETVTLDRSQCRWRGLDIERVEEAMRTGEPHFTMPPTNAKCPVCGRRFRTRPSDAFECCSLSCATKMKWIRRKA